MHSPVVVRSLSKRYRGGVEALRAVSFEVKAGEIFGLLGPNGAGKTTALECLTGLREPDAGEILVCGVDVLRQSRAAMETVGVALQHMALPDQITPREALQLFGSFYARSTSPRALLERFALTDKADARFVTLSGGQRQRLALALAFVNQPDLVVLDEPTAGLDLPTCRELRGEIARMKREGHTVLISTHDLTEAEQLCDRVAILIQGTIVAVGTPSELVARSHALQTVTLLSTPPLDHGELARLPGVEQLRAEAGAARFCTSQPTATLAALAALLEKHSSEVIDLQVRKASLEEVFLRLTGAGGVEGDRSP